jgi:hypothetical protein
MAGALGACSNGVGPSGSQVSLSFSTRAPGAAAAPRQGLSLSVAAPFTQSDGTNKLVITQAEVVLREIELERIETDDCDSAGPGSCEEFETGPMLLDVPLNGETEVVVTIPVEPGAYDELEFEFHRVSSDDPQDAAFREAHPDLVETSIRVRGTFNGAPFTYQTDLDVEQEFDLAPPLVIAEDVASTNVTVRLDLAAWFRDGAGMLLDPQTGNQGEVNEGLIKENIKQSVEAFEDRDRDGDDRDEG